MRNLLIAAIGIMGLLIVFTAGMVAQRHDQIEQIRFNRPMGRLSMDGEHHFGGRFFDDNTDAVISGKVTAINGNDFIIDQNGSTKTIKTDTGTRFAELGINGLKVDDQVTVIGTTNSDSSVQASRVAVDR